MNKLNSICIALFGMFCLYIFTSSSNGRTDRRSGAPGDTTCATSSCHGDNALNSGNGSIAFAIAGNPSDYKPDSIYAVTLTATGSGISTYGFQITAVDANGDNGGTFIAGSGTKLASNAGRSYCTHNATSSSGVWNFQWQAPTFGTGAVTFYFIANATELPAGNTGGDFIYSSTLMMDELLQPAPAPIADFSLSSDSICASQSIIITDQSQNATDWIWYFGTGSNPETATGAGPHIIEYDSVASPDIQLVVQNIDGASDSLIRMNALQVDACTDINSLSFEHVAIFPNPASKVFSISSSTEYNRVIIYDLNGKQVLDQLNALDYTIDQLAIGNYLVELRLNNDLVGQEQLVIKR